MKRRGRRWRANRMRVVARATAIINSAEIIERASVIRDD